MTAASTSGLLDEYNRIEQQLATLDGSSDQLQCLDRQLDVLKHNFEFGLALLCQMQKNKGQLKKSIHHYTKLRRFRYFFGNRRDKVVELQEEFEHLSQMERVQICTLDSQKAQKSALQLQRSDLKNVVENKRHLELTQRILFDLVVDAQPPNQALQRLQQQRALLTSDNEFLDQIRITIERIQRARSLMRNAESIYRQVVEFCSDVCRKRQLGGHDKTNQDEEQEMLIHGAENCASPGTIRGNAVALGRMKTKELEEAHAQCFHIDTLQNQAYAAAVSAFEIMDNAFETLSSDGKSRYVILCASVGDVHFPRPQKPNANTVDDLTPACDMQKNTEFIQQCLAMASQQLEVVSTLEVAVSGNIQQLQHDTRDAEQIILTERNNIFNCLRIEE
jgi:hypothetical protein